MTPKWRKTFAVLLTVALVFLSLTAEFSHSHIYTTTHLPRVAQNHGDGDNAGSVRLHGFVCVACLYGMGNLAPALTFETFHPKLENFFAVLSESTFHFVILSVSYYLRAPPYAAA